MMLRVAPAAPASGRFFVPAVRLLRRRPGPPSQPGRNRLMTNVLGILTDLQATPPVLDPGITRVWTTGTRVEGRAPGVYIHDDGFDLATWPMAGFTDDSDRIFRFDYSSSELRPGHFGVLGDGTEDDLPAMQDFCDFVT